MIYRGLFLFLNFVFKNQYTPFAHASGAKPIRLEIWRYVGCKFIVVFIISATNVYQFFYPKKYFFRKMANRSENKKQRSPESIDFTSVSGLQRFEKIILKILLLMSERYF